jgi:tetratricopeptide (TPR) repeat protein
LRADVYGLTCVLWECLAGAPPFRRSSEFATLFAHLNDAVPKLRSPHQELPAGLEGVLSRGLAKTPVDRYESCGELVADARAAARPLRIHGRRLVLAVGIVAATAALGTALGIGIDRLVDDPGTSTTLLTTTVEPYGSHELDAAAYALMRDGQYAAALPFSLAAVRELHGTGPIDPYEGYANFNLGRILFKLGRCDEAVPYVQRARRLQPTSKETQQLLKRTLACAGTS